MKALKELFYHTGWQQYGTGANSWVQGYFTGPILGPDGSDYYAIHSWDAAYINRSLETNGVSLNGYASASLEYYVYHSGTWGEIIYMEISTDGGGSGGTWSNLLPIVQIIVAGVHYKQLI